MHSSVLLPTCFISFYELCQQSFLLHTHLKWLKRRIRCLTKTVNKKICYTLECTQTGVPEPMVQWRREGGKDIVLRAESRDKQGE